MFFKRGLPALFAATCCVSFFGPVHADPFLPVPPASFLNYHVSTARGLSEEVAEDVVVRARLARHFHMTQGAVVDYVRQNLVESTLTPKQAGRYRIACITPSGREYSISEYLSAGTPVFDLAATGRPILRLACGNPLVSSLPTIVHRLKPAVLAPSAKAVVQPLVSPLVAADQTFAFSSPLVQPKASQIVPMVNVAGVSQSLSKGGSSFVPAALVGLVGISALHSHGNTPSVTPPSPPVPEASPLLLLGLGLLTMAVGQAGLRRRRKTPSK